MSKLSVTTGKNWWLTALIWFAAIAPASALELRVAIQQNVKQINVGSSTKAVVRDESGRALGEIQGMNGFTAQANGGTVALDRWNGGEISVEPTEGGVVWIGDRWYRGRALLVPRGSGLTAVNYVDLEHYLYSVLGSEMNGNWPQEALKAQAVAARSYALYQRQSANTVFDVGDTDSWQVYTGVDRESQGTQMAVEATKGQVIVHNGRIINAVFHSSSGGCIDNVEEVWTQPLPYLRAKRDFDQGAPVYQWSKPFSRDQLSRRITGVGEIVSMVPEKVTTCGRIVSMRVKGDKGERSISGDALRAALDLRSTLFSVSSQGGQATKSNSKPSPISFVVNGKGFGHGLGLSQYGAYNLATQQRWNYQQIVRYYYDNATLAKIEVK
ncbi:SpoIID/LytB domain-containing protein [Phormidesmis sp. 146-35]